MAQVRVRATGEDGCHLAGPRLRERAHLVDTAMNGPQARCGHAALHLARAQACAEQLRPGDEAVLAGCQPGDQLLVGASHRAILRGPGSSMRALRGRRCCGAQLVLWRLRASGT